MINFIYKVSAPASQLPGGLYISCNRARLPKAAMTAVLLAGTGVQEQGCQAKLGRGAVGCG